MYGRTKGKRTSQEKMKSRSCIKIQHLEKWTRRVLANLGLQISETSVFVVMYSYRDLNLIWDDFLRE